MQKQLAHSGGGSDIKIPTHIGFILDGNRRWAKKHGLPTYEGHLAGVTALEDVLEACVNAGVEYISFYTWSTENWNRAEAEVRATMKIVRSIFSRELKRMIKEGCRFVAMGDIESVPADIKKLIQKAEEESQSGTRSTLVMCFNYGGQQEILRATSRAIASGVAADSLSPAQFEKFLDHPDVPACDVIVRTSGEQRLSNFMLWRAAYSELIFLDKLWPEMTAEDVNGILYEYTKRDRRFGG